MLKHSYTYTGTDNRVRIVYVNDDGSRHTKSYPRILMEEKLGRPLEPFEDVHHLDNNPLNNSIENLVVKIHGEHQREHNPSKYKDTYAFCEVCGTKFIWTAKRQRTYYIDLRRGKDRIISCSRSCSSFYGRQEQLGRNL